MRIVTGLLKGRTIPYNPRKQGDIRLTSGLLKEALFAMLGADLNGQSFLDLCAGCGQIGLEAYSRGARATLNEPDRRRAAHLETLCNQWHLRNLALHRLKAQALIPHLEQTGHCFDYTYLDPPYRAQLDGQPLSLALLRRIGSSALPAPQGLLIVQHQRELAPPEEMDQLSILRQRAYGNTTLSVYQRS